MSDQIKNYDNVMLVPDQCIFELAQNTLFIIIIIIMIFMYVFIEMNF